MKILTFITIFLIIILPKSTPRDYEFRIKSLTQEEGFYFNFPSGLLHDSRGFMWFGARDGLKRYDGYNFKNYNYDGPDTASLSNNHVISMKEDNEGDIWIGTLMGGLNRYNRATDDFTRYPGSGADPFNLGKSSVFAICVLRSGEVWFSAQSAHSQGVYRLVPSTGRVLPVIHDTVDTQEINENSGFTSAVRTRTILEDKKRDIWIGGTDGLYRYDPETGSFMQYRNDPEDPFSLSSDSVNCIYEDLTGDLWVGTYDGLNRMGPDRQVFQRYYHDPADPESLRYNWVTAISEDNHGNLVVRARQSINIMDLQTQVFDYWTWDVLPPPLGPDVRNIQQFHAMRQLYVDEGGIIWFATLDCFQKLFLERRKFDFASGDGFVPSVTHHDADGGIWIATWGDGLYRMVPDGSGNSSRQLHDLMSDGILSRSELVHYRNTPGDPYGLSSNFITSICRDRGGTLWIAGGETGILYALDESKKRERFIPYLTDTMPRRTGWRLTQICEDRERNLWIGGGTGLYIFDRTQKRFYQYMLDSGGQSYTHDILVNVIYEDKAGNIWIGTWMQGLFRIVPPVELRQPGTATGVRTISYRFDPGLPGDLGDYPVLSLCEPRVRATPGLWIGTYGGGLFSLIVQEAPEEGFKEEFIRYSMSDGLPSNTIWAILEDGRGYLWIATDDGLSRFDPVTGGVVTYHEINGLPVRHFGWLSGQKGRHGEFTFTMDTILLAFNPDSMEYNEFIPPVVITDFRLFNKPVAIGENSPLKRSITETEELELSYRENYLSFEFAALNYLNTEGNRYRYRMEGLDRDWIEAGLQRQANYSHLKPGKYVFHVMGSNNEGIWNEKGASVGIIIRPPPWFRWWAYGIYGLIIMGIVLWYRNFLISRERLRSDLKLKQVEVEKALELDRMKTRFFSNVSHEFRTPLTLILGPLEKLLNDHPKVKEWDWNVFHVMRRNAQKLKGLINQILDLSKLETGQMKLRVSPGNVTGFLKNIVLSFLSLAESKNIVYKFKLSETSAKVCFDRDKLDKIATNLIANAFKFTPEGGEVSVRLSFPDTGEQKTPEFLELCVRDSGKGIPGNQLDRIFDRYFQGEDPGSGMKEGTGLGLALVKELVGLYRGEIRVDSKPGKGSTFKVRLPVSPGSFTEDEIHEPLPADDAEYGEFQGIQPRLPDEGSIEPEMVESRGEKESQYKPVLLVVEDNAELIHYIRQSLGPAYLFHEALNGREGIEKATALIPDLIVSDIMMPVMDGLEMCKSLKADERTSHIPIILLTAKGDMESKIGGLQTGADDYLVKPFDAKELKARTQNLIEQRRKLRERYRKEMLLGKDAIGLLPSEERFLEKLAGELNRHISEPDYNVRKLADAMGMNRVQLYRKILSLTDQTPSEFIRNTRLKYAAGLLDQGYRNIAEVTYLSGFNSPSYFSSCFKELYGKNPKEYISG